MSMLMRETSFGPRALQLQWLNTIVTTHAMICSCEKPFKHLENLLQQQDAKCLFITEGEGTSGQEQTGKENKDSGEDVLDYGDLDKLFEEDFTEEPR